MEIVVSTHAGLTTEEFERVVKDWLAMAKHPKTGRLYTEMSYPPMVELLAYLLANGSKTYIVSGGGIEFMRAFAETVYSFPPSFNPANVMEQTIRRIKVQEKLENAFPILGPTPPGSEKKPE